MSALVWAAVGLALVSGVAAVTMGTIGIRGLLAEAEDAVSGKGEEG